MAAISRIVALPSATQYNPVPPELDEIFYSGNYLETPGIRIDFNYPSQFWKNKAPFDFVSPFYKEVVRRDSDGATIYEDVAFALAGFNSPILMPAGTLCNYQSYAIANGSTVYSPIAYFTAQTKPNSPTSITLVSSSYTSIQVSWSDLLNTANWGGAPDADREWEIFVQKFLNPQVGYDINVATSILPYAARNYSLGGFFDGQYRVVLYSRTKAGRSQSFASTGDIFLSPPPPFFPFFGPSFPPIY